MTNKTSNFIAPLFAAVLQVAAFGAIAQDNGISTREDLATVLALKGKPCGGIVELERQHENAYLVTCKDGHRYRIFIDANDRVVVEERK